MILAEQNALRTSNTSERMSRVARACYQKNEREPRNVELARAGAVPLR